MEAKKPMTTEWRGLLPQRCLQAAEAGCRERGELKIGRRNFFRCRLWAATGTHVSLLPSHRCPMVLLALGELAGESTRCAMCDRRHLGNNARHGHARRSIAHQGAYGSWERMRSRICYSRDLIRGRDCETWKQERFPNYRR
jgi:hypothetical protein